MYTLKKVEQIFNKAMEHFSEKRYVSLDSYLQQCGLSTDEWSQIFRSVRMFINQNQISVFFTDEYFKQEYIHYLNQQHLIIDIEKNMFTIKYIKRQLELLEKFEESHCWAGVDKILNGLDFYEDEYNEIVEETDGWDISKQEIIKTMINIMNQKGLVIDFKKR